MQLSNIGLWFAILGFGCGVDSTGDPPITPIEKKMCPSFQCGPDNSPLIHGAYFHELNTTSTAMMPIPMDGVALVDFRKGNLHLALHVSHGRLSGTAQGATFSGQALAAQPEAMLIVRTNGIDFAVRITSVGSVGYWAHNGGSPMIETYHLQYALLNRIGTDPWVDVCQNPPGELGPDTLTMAGHQHDVVVFEGERIEETHRTVNVDPSGQWFNIGCAGGTLAKMYLTGHTIAAAFDGFVTTQAERQAIVKMFSADYCGDGTAFTVQGQPLRWADDHHWMGFFPMSTTTLETRWTENGASCMGVPRASIPGTPANDMFGANVATQISTACDQVGHPIPACADHGLYLDGYHLLSANP